MSRQLLYLIGQPGSGKSTLVAGLTAGVPSAPVEKPFAHIVWGSGPAVIELGARRESFAGTDALGMSVQPRVVEWLAGTPHEFVLAEGDRLANGKFFTAVAGLGWEVTVARLAVSEAAAAQRRAARAAALGIEPQSPLWLRGRVTKVRNLAREWATIDLDADQPAAGVLTELLTYEHPVVEVLRSQR